MGSSDLFTISALLVLIMGAACFYLYTRIKQVEKKLTLVEGILLDLKTATEASFMDFPAATSYLLAKDLGAEDDDEDYIPEAPISNETDDDDDEGIAAFKDDDVEELEVQEVATEPATTASVQVNKIIEAITAAPPDLELLNVKELMAIARSKGLTISKTMRKQQIIDAINAAAALPAVTTNTTDEMTADVDGMVAESTFMNGTTLDSAPI
jgi:plasmid maintenance system killer protein